MSDLPPDLPRLRTLETYLQLQLDAVRAAIAHAEKPPADDPIGGAPGIREQHSDGPAREDIRWWRMEPAQPLGTDPHPARVHRGDCLGHRGLPLLTREEALTALTDVQDGRRTAEPCQRCRPDTGLGLA